MMTPLVLPAPAKLNLFLHIIGRTHNGYHALQTVFQFLDFGDELIFEHHDALILDCRVKSLMIDDNLVLKAARLLRKVTGCRHGARITLIKRLPMGGGIGGGSSDAATALHGLNRLWKLGLSEDELADLGLQLGADVPVFVRGRAAFAEGVGEVLTPISPDEYWYLVLQPDCHVNTAEMFRHPDLVRNTPAVTADAALGLLRKRFCPRKKKTNDLGINDIGDDGGEESRSFSCRNDFEGLVRRLYPEVDKCLLLLDNANVLSMGQAVMSGSGACVFAPFASRKQAETAQVKIGSGVSGFVACGVNRSPLRTAIGQLYQCSA